MVQIFESACGEGDWGLIPWSGRSPGEGNGYPLQLFSPGKSQGWRSLAGYNPWGHKKLDTNERLIFSLSLQDSISLKYLFGEGENNLLLSSNWYYQFLTLSLITSIHLFILSAGKFWRSLYFPNTIQSSEDINIQNTFSKFNILGNFS